MLPRITRYVVVIAFFTFAAGEVSACVTDSGFSPYSRNNINKDINDFGALTLDADDPNCAKVAAERLQAKISNMLDSEFQQSLAGYEVALIFAAAVRLGSFGYFNTSGDQSNNLAYQLNRVLVAYEEESHAVGCGTGFEGNSCMDDYAGEAAAWGWMSAYKKKRGDGNTFLAAYTAGQRLESFFNNVCIFDQANYDNGDHRVCNGTTDDLADGTGRVFAFEHDIETPHYGFGLLTSVAQTIVGLEAAGAGYTLSETQKRIVRSMWDEVNVHIGNWYGQECLDPYLSGGEWLFHTQKISCADFGYDPSMYELRDFLINHADFTPPPGSFQAVGGNSWPNLANYDDPFSYGRKVTYNEQASLWYVNRGNAYSPRYMPFNNSAAQGYLDAVSDTGVAFGWACDSDKPDGTVKVDFYVNGVKIDDDPSHYPSSGSEPAVNNLCGGGTAHRFWVQLPWWAQGQAITAYARDYTFGFSVPLTCLEAQTCVW